MGTTAMRRDMARKAIDCQIACMGTGVGISTRYGGSLEDRARSKRVTKDAQQDEDAAQYPVIQRYRIEMQRRRGSRRLGIRNALIHK